MILFVTQDKSHHSMGGRGNFSVYRICTVCHEKIHLEFISCHGNTGCPTSEAMYSYTVGPFILTCKKKKNQNPKTNQVLSLPPPKCRKGDNPWFFERFLSFLFVFKHAYSSKKSHFSWSLYSYPVLCCSDPAFDYE